MVTVQEILPLADVQKFLKQMDAESTYKMCHQACVWLAVEIKKAGIPDYSLHLATGTYLGKDHSWLIVEGSEEPHQIIDMTVDQFENIEVPYVCNYDNEKYQLENSISLISDPDDLKNFVESLGD
ncbi:hypothetical protein vBAmePPT11V19_00050 [Alteromonas phage vB_AmeP_PT11-V19]|nr:hypothetical protein vBAmePPT11V19_00050 [Alteromonas phage vB_AmeP_PT11-V19]